MWKLKLMKNLMEECVVLVVLVQAVSTILLRRIE